MKLVMTHHDSDGCTYFCDNTTPFEYESKELAEFDFEVACEVAYERGRYETMKFCGAEFSVNQFFDNHKYFGPKFFTLEEWFETHKINK